MYLSVPAPRNLILIFQEHSGTHMYIPGTALTLSTRGDSRDLAAWDVVIRLYGGLTLTSLPWLCYLDCWSLSVYPDPHVFTGTYRCTAMTLCSDDIAAFGLETMHILTMTGLARAVMDLVFIGEVGSSRCESV